MLKGWKTTVFNLVVLFFAAIETGTYNNLIPDNMEPGILMIVAGINVLLRLFTNTPVGRKE